MPHFAALERAWRSERAHRLARFSRAPTIAEQGLVLGPRTVVAKRVVDRWGGPDLALAHDEARALALLAVAHWRPVSPAVIGDLRRAAKAQARGDKSLAAIHIAHTGLPKIAETEEVAFRLFAAEKMLDDGLSPRELMTGLGLDPWPLDAIKCGLGKYSPDEPRDDRGRWTSGDAGSVASAVVLADYIGSADKSSDLTAADGKQIVTLASDWNGTNYAPKHTAYAGPNAKKGTAADCSGSVWAIYGQAGLNYRYTDTADFASAAANDAIPFRQLTDEEALNPQPGDVVLYPGPGHMSIYAGDGTVWGAHKPGFPFALKPIKYFDDGGGYKIYRYQDSGSAT